MRLPLALALLAVAVPAAAQQPHHGRGAAGFSLEDAAGGATFQSPVALAFTPDGRMFVAEKRGVVWVVQDGEVLAEPFVDLQGEVLDNVDRGLLGLAVDDRGRAFLLYTVDHDGSGDYDRSDVFGRLTRYDPLPDDPNRADLASRRVLVGETFAEGFVNCSYSHAIGTVTFGADGTLLVGSGDGAHPGIEADAGGRHPDCFGPGRFPVSEDIGAFRALRLESLAGKILRLDPETGRGLPSNPFWTGDGRDAASKVWAYGLRNPYRFTVRPEEGAVSGPGLVVAGDVGWSTWEELDVIRGGENFGWPCWEGPAPNVLYQAADPPTNGCDGMPPHERPQAYWHQVETARSLPPGRLGWTIVGGALNEGSRYPAEYAGAYFYGDYTFGWTALARFDADGTLLSDEALDLYTGFAVDYEYDPLTEAVHLVDIVQGKVYRLLHSGDANAHPVARASADPLQGDAPLTVAFSSAGSADPEGDPLTYRWRFGDGAESDEGSPTHTYAEEGVHRAVLLASDGSATAIAWVDVAVGRRYPTVAIDAPAPDARARPGEVVRLEATAADADQPAATLEVTWTATLVHGDHAHPVRLDAAGASATLLVPVLDDLAAGDAASIRLQATVTDADALRATAERALAVAPPAAFAVEAVYPNPTAGEAAVRVALDRPGAVAVEVFDVLGRRVSSWASGEVGAGVHAWPLDLGGVSAGRYVLRARHLGTGAVRSRAFTVVR